MDETLRQKGSLVQQALGLQRPPIAVAFVDQPPAAAERVEEAVPSACSFWRMAERAVFYASEEEHRHCPVGMMTMGFQVAPEGQSEAEAIVTALEMGRR